ncbi:Queuosine precursor transporter [uncultured Caudovirales phage]|uniref:Queuosine transporter n=1 Tax=uncultured Caudovirales phage TaxID=2100421 RepID=A0A6J5KL43_9CAUD|nr:Queuosine precursor transporter [uncultured Caudovirales phage]
MFTTKNLAAKLILLQTAIIVISNWLVTYKFSVFGNPLTYAVFTLPMMFVATDLTVRLVGKQLAQTVVLRAVIPGMLFTAAVLAALGSPESVIYRITVASGVANCLPILADIYVFQWVRQKWGQWWVAPATSGIVTTIIMTYLFYFTAFAGGNNQFMSDNWYLVATNQILGKIFMNLLVLLPAYGLLLNYLQGRIARNEAMA